MKLSTKCRYGARAIVEIARNDHNGPVKRKDIVKNQEISDSYLENILITLKNGGIINAIRGANGGYMLRRPASEITLLEIVNVLEGSLAPVECIDTPSVCHRTDNCSTRGVWKNLKEAKEDVLRNVTVQKLVDDEKEPYRSDYSI
jgi:Rrf2 family protein